MDTNEDTNEHEIVYKELSYRIMSAVLEVHNTLGCGFLEATGLRLGIIINFAKPRLEYRRVVV